MLQDINLLIELLESILISLILELSLFPPSRILAPLATPMFLLYTQATKPLQEPSPLIINKSVKKLATLNDSAFQSLFGVWHVIHFIFIFVRLGRSWIDITHETAPKSEIFVWSD